MPILDYHGMYIEMKSGTGRLSPDQKRIIKNLQARHYHVVVCRSATEAMMEIKEYLNGTCVRKEYDNGKSKA
jgi:hypothetical protein